MRTIRNIALGVAALAAGLFAAPQLQASTCDILNFTTSTACVSPISGGPGGNVTETQMNTQAIFGATNWTLLDKLDAGSPSTGQTQEGTNGLFSLTFGSPALQNGTWTLTSEWTWGAGICAFVIKGAKDNAAYLMDVSSTNGTWFVNDLNLPNKKNKNNPDLSNIQLFGTDNLAPIPLPAAAWMLLAALGGLGLVSRRRRAAAA